MNVERAKEVLLCYRPGTSDVEDPEVMQALALAEQDSNLAEWLEAHQAFQRGMRKKFAEIPAPAHLKQQLLIQSRIAPVPVWRRPVAWLSAAAAVLVLFLATVELRTPRPVPDRFSDYQKRMVSTALRQYRMEIITSDMGTLRGYLAEKGGPADYSLPEGLQKLSLTGGGALKWRSNPVSMVCFDRGDNQMLFLFVMDRAALKDPPSETPQTAVINELRTVTWTEGDRTYLLAGPEEPNFTQKYL